MIRVGNPVRRELLTGSKEQAQKILRICGQGRLTVLVLGGSRGCRRINDLILEILPRLSDEFEIIHQTGERDLKEIVLQADALLSPEQRNYYHVFDFLQEETLKQAYAAADLIISRAGSNVIFEIALLEKPCILIPLTPAAQDHQVKNAYSYAASGAGIVLEEANLTANFFLEKIKYVLAMPKLLEKMRQAARSFATPEAAKIIANDIIDFLSGGD